LIFIRTFKSELKVRPATEIRELEFNEWMKRSIEISGWKVRGIDRNQISAAAIMVGTIVGFIVYERFDMTPAFVALAGGSLMLMMQSREPTKILRTIDWSNLLFLAGLFVVINGMEKVGLIEMISDGLTNLIGVMPLNASIAVMWLSGLASSLIDNIPLATSLARL
ncbi:MAG: SLC13 family permease, partial [Candidatus Bathyarchaeia archaeon]